MDGEHKLAASQSASQGLQADMRVTTLAIETLPLMASWSEFTTLLGADANFDGRFLHSIDFNVEQVPYGLTRGVNLFGPNSFPIMEGRNGLNKTRRVESFLLANATLTPQSMTILDSRGQLVLAAMQNIGDPKAIGQYDGAYKITEDGDLALSDSFFANRKTIDTVALPICGPGIYNYGHFLYDGLAGALMHHQLLGDGAKIVGPPLRPWQSEILDALNLLPYYLPIHGPTTFSKVLGTSMLSLHVSYPSRFVRVVFDQIRFNLGASDLATKSKIFLSRGTDQRKRVLTNRAEVDALMTQLGFEVVCPDLLSFREQVALMASARLVVGEAGAGLANIGFCDPGARVLEILTMPDGWIRGQCFLMGHKWHGFFPTITPAGEGAAGAALSYSIDCDELAEAIAVVTAGQ